LSLGACGLVGEVDARSRRRKGSAPVVAARCLWSRKRSQSAGRIGLEASEFVISG